MVTREQTMYPGALEPPHDVRDRAKVARLVTAMERDGWVGRPLLVVDCGVYVGWTGSHRLVAAAQAGIDVPCLVISPDWETWGEQIEAVTDEASRLAVLLDMQEAGEDVAQAVELMRTEIANDRP